jgi:hypothetical protein
MKIKLKDKDKIFTKKHKVNPLLVLYSLIALAFIILAFTLNPYFMIGAVVFMVLGQRELGKGK